MRTLVWFRADLRVDDNPALAAASAESDQGVVGLFIACPRVWQSYNWSKRKTSFLLSSLQQLSAKLERLNIPLLFRVATDYDHAAAIVEQVCLAHGVERVHFNAECELNEVARDEDVSEILGKSSILVRSHLDQLLCEPGTVRSKSGTPYTVFTPYSKRVMALLEEADGPLGPDPYELPPKQADTGIGPDPIPAAVEGFTDAASVDAFEPGESAGLSRLRAFCRDQLATYGQLRDTPSIDGTSTLSPHFAAGTIGARRVLRTALEADASTLQKSTKSAQRWINEVLWRDFFRSIAVNFPRVVRGSAFRVEYNTFPWREDPAGFEAWCKGETGYPLVDAGMRQLLKTGWMHNRLRMITAMFLSKHLLIDWRLGERFFMEQLVDGDFCSNNGGWQWSSSTGTDAQPYFRVFNPVEQAKRWDTDAVYQHRFLPELRSLNAEEILSLTERGGPDLGMNVDYPAPIVEHAMARERAIDAFKAYREETA